MAVNVKMGVDLGSFTSGIRQGQQVLKGLNAEMKASEAEFKATGNAEQKLTSQTKTLNSQIQVQKGIADQAQQALQAMTAAGIQPTDAAYQKLYVTLMNATAGMNNAQAALNDLRGGTENAKQGADDLTDSLKGIGNKISLEQVKSGIDSITNGLESAARKAVELGKELWDMIMDSARRADDTATMADMYHIPLERFLQMQGLVGNGMDTTVDNMLSAQDKLAKGIGNKTATVINTLDDLNLAYKQATKTGSEMVLVTQDQEQMFWLAGQAIMNMGEGYDKEAAATALFGKSWRELSSLFENYKSLEEYNAALSKVTVNDEQTIRDLAELNDAVGKLERSWTVLKDEMLGSIAPALTAGADAISGLLDKLTEYLKTDEGQAMLEKLSTAVNGLFEDLGNIDPQKVIEGFVGVFDKVVQGVEYLVDNKDSIVSGLKAIFGIWATLEVSSGVMTILKVIDGLKWLRGGGGGGAGGTGGTNAVAVAGGATLAEWATFGLVDMAPVWLLAEAIRNETQGQAEDQRKAALRTADYVETAGKVLGTGDESLMAATNAILSLGDSNQSVNVDAFKGLAQLWADWNDWRKNDESNPVWEALTEALSGETYDRFGELMDNVLTGATLDQRDTTELIEQVMKEIGEYAEANTPEIPVQMTVPSDEAARLSELIGTVLINGQIVIGEDAEPHANGIWSVPRDNYLARLHKGERVLPARAVSSQNYNSNLYVESMYMNNGTDAAGLAAAMAAAQRRQMSGYGS